VIDKRGVASVVTALATNTAEIGSDLAAVLTLGKLPPGTLLYYGETQLAYEPAVPGQ
jgi:hypothetical protein